MRCFSFIGVLAVVALPSAIADEATPLDAAASASFYTSYDDVSWAIVSSNLTTPLKQQMYDNYMQGCREGCYEEDQTEDHNKNRADRLCDNTEALRLQMNMYQPRSMRNYTKVGFQKIRAPEAVMKIIQEFWENNKDEATIEWRQPTPYHNNWDVPPTIVRVDNQTLTGGGSQLQAAIADAARDAMEAWTGLPQSSTSVYGIRIYHNQSILSPHVDRLPLVSSAIINVAQDVDEDWFLEVYDHDGVAHNVTMSPGDLVLYESHSVIHGRPFPLNGKFFANIFVHFEPLGAPKEFDDVREGLDLPPYLIEGSSWEPEWRKNNPNGWQLLQDAHRLVKGNEYQTLRYMAEVNPSKLNEPDGTKAIWRPIHEAARQGYLDFLKFFIEHGIDVNTECKVADIKTPLAIARRYHGTDHPTYKYLASMGGVIDPAREEVENNQDNTKEEL